MLASKEEKVSFNKNKEHARVKIDEDVFGLSSFDAFEGYYSKQVKKAESKAMISFQKSVKAQRTESEVARQASMLTKQKNVNTQSANILDTTNYGGANQNSMQAANMSQSKVFMQDTQNKNETENQWESFLNDEFVIHLISDQAWYKQMQRENHDKIVWQQKIISKLKKVIHKEKKNWLATIEKNEDERIKDDMDYNNQKEKWKAETIDQFNWLKVPSKFNLLKQMVREKLIEIIGEKDQREKIEEALDVYLGKKTKNPDHKLFNSKINLDEMKKQKEMDKLQEKGVMYKASAVNKRNFSLKSFMEHFEKGEPKHFQGSMAIGKVNAFPSDFKWDKSKEETYQSARMNASSQLYPMVQSTTFRENGFSEFVQKVSRQAQNFSDNEDRPCFYVYNENDGSDFEDEQLTQKKTNNLRDELLDRYMSGEWMTVEEIKYICMSSLTLNKFLDKKFHQRATDILDPEFIEGIEMNIAEQIIYSYYEIRNKIKDSRDNFLKRRNDHLHKKIYHLVPNQKKDYPEPFSYKTNSNAQSELKINQKFLHLQNDIVTNLLVKLYKKEELKKISPDDQDSKLSVDVELPEEYHEGRWLKKIQSKSYKNNNPKVLSNIKARNDRDSRDQKFSVQFGKTTAKSLLHKQHPPSKVFNIDGEYNPQARAQNAKEIEKYKLMRVSDDKFVSKKDFHKTYSSGPLTRDFRLKRPKDQIKRAVIYIQKIVRGYLQRNLFKKYKKNKSIYAGMKESQLQPPSASQLYRPKYRKNFLTDNCNMKNVFSNDRHFKSLQNLRLAKKQEDVYTEVLGYNDDRAKVPRNGINTQNLNRSKDSKIRVISATHVGSTRKPNSKLYGNDVDMSRLSYNESQTIEKTRFDLTKSMTNMKDTNENYQTTMLNGNYSGSNQLGPKKYDIGRKKDNYDSLRFLRKPTNIDLQPKMNYTNPYVFSAKYYKSKNRPVSSYESQNRFELRKKAQEFRNKYSKKQKHILECLQNRDFQKLANSNYIFVKLDVNIKDEYETPVQNIACQMQESDFVTFFITKGTTINSRDRWGNTPLMDAFANGNKKIIEILLHNNANLALKNHERNTALDRCHYRLREDKAWLKMIEDVYNFRTYHDS